MAIDDFQYIAWGFGNYLIFYVVCRGISIVKEFLQ